MIFMTARKKLSRSTNIVVYIVAFSLKLTLLPFLKKRAGVCVTDDREIQSTTIREREKSQSE
jgi:hypothetical protein